MIFTDRIATIGTTTLVPETENASQMVRHFAPASVDGRADGVKTLGLTYVYCSIKDKERLEGIAYYHKEK